MHQLERLSFTVFGKEILYRLPGDPVFFPCLVLKLSLHSRMVVCYGIAEVGAGVCVSLALGNKLSCVMT